MQEHWQFTLLLTSVVALMLNFTPVISTPDIIQANPTMPASTHFKDYDVVLKHLVDSYKKIIFDHFETADLQFIQSLLLMVVTGGCQRGFRVTACWGYMGMAVRMAHELGIHRNAKEFGVHHPRFDKPSMDVRNRTWHCVVIMETYTCMWTGRPLTIHGNDWDAEYPDLLTPEMASLKHHGDLVHIVGCILKFGNRARQVDVDYTIAEISGKLESWLKRLDSDWKELVFQQRWNVKALMMLIYHGAVILFHRVAFGRVDTLECLASATAITKLISRFEKPPETNECIALFPTFTYCSMLACTVHMNQILSNATIADTRRFISSVQNLETCMKVFDALREIFMDVERCWKTMLDFLSIKGLSLEELVRNHKPVAETSSDMTTPPSILLNSITGAPVSQATVSYLQNSSTQDGNPFWDSFNLFNHLPAPPLISSSSSSYQPFQTFNGQAIDTFQAPVQPNPPILYPHPSQQEQQYDPAKCNFQS
ncbi:hypothetical protein BDR26DRAFT_873587 [Obelidium mucronatum]|nr:hypothetical protein BDR26DRAFT_873587 [Obelidium mucronatum]